MRKIILNLSAALLASTPAWAINCQVETNCTTLGYTSSKDEGNCLKCPFGNQWACLKTDTSENCEIGNILYSDMTISSNFNSSKTPIGIVFDCNKKLAVALEASQYSEVWSTEFFDIPALKNYSPQTKEVISEVITDFQGESNTQIISDYCKSNNKACKAIEYINNYKTTGTKAGDWHLPSMGELERIFTYKSILNVYLEIAGGSNLNQTYWSSNEFNSDSMWIYNLRNPNRGALNKNIEAGIRPVLKFPVSSGGDDSDTDTGTCKIGDILYSDKTCSTDYDSSKTPIGLIFDSDKRLAMSIEKEKFSTWSTIYADAPTLPNIEDSTSALSDWNGKENTKAIAEYCKSKSYSCPAAEYVNNYKTVGTSAGDWYIPALGELQAIYENMLILNYGLSKIYGAASRRIALDNIDHWSSTESGGGKRAGIWTLQFTNGEALNTNKTFDAYILPVIKY